ncbi:unnamed protein product [Brassica oleracea var. botrytis]|uniref:Uncharacterized protein n=1 Tax=Brassica cretica TaxID=69181 RepID=A0ABQ7C7J4_BRACR|nr:hypothetical protein DY000_02010670 [Brassica cretica]
MGEFVDLKTFLARDGTLCKYNKEQRTFVADLAFKIASCRHESKKESKKVAKEISNVLRKPNMYGHDDDVDHISHLSTLSSPLEILRIFADTDLEERSIELAIRRLYVLLSDHTSKKVVVIVGFSDETAPATAHFLP